MHPSDEQLMAYADGELPAAEAEAIAALAAQNPVLARRIAAFAASRRLLQDSFAPIGAPQRTLDMLRAGSVSPSRRRHVRRWLPLAMAAGLVLAVAVAVLTGTRDGPMPQLPASVQAALESLPSGAPSEMRIEDKPVELLMLATLRLPGGDYCREYAMTALDDAAATEAQATACRDADGRWHARHAAPTGAAPDNGRYELAAGPSAPALPPDAVRLTSEQERAVLATGWGTRTPR